MEITIKCENESDAKELFDKICKYTAFTFTDDAIKMHELPIKKSLKLTRTLILGKRKISYRALRL